MAMQFDASKFKELVLYVAEKSADDPSFGATKLNKTLFFSDFYAYGELGKPMTGATYQKLDRGPAPRELPSIQQQLQEEGAAAVFERSHFNYLQKRLLPLRPADLSQFSPQEVALVDEVIEALKYHTALEVSRVSHAKVLGWQLAGEREEIPYQSVFLSSEPPTPTDIKRGRELAKEHGWL